MRTQRSYEFICDWFKRSSVRADQIGCPEVAQMWLDGLQHLEAMREQRDELLAAGEAVLADCADVDTESRLTLKVGRQLRDAIDKALS